jgi:Transposase, Mutator family
LVDVVGGLISPDAANVMARHPEERLRLVKALLHSVYNQPDANAMHAQFDRILDALADKLPAVAHHWDRLDDAEDTPRSADERTDEINCQWHVRVIPRQQVGCVGEVRLRAPAPLRGES